MRLFLPLLLFPFSASAATLELAQAVSEALRGSPRIQRTESERDEARWKKLESAAGFLPSVSASGSHLFDKKYALTDLSFGGAMMSVPQIIPTTQVGLTGVLPVFDGFANIGRYRAASAFADAAEKDLGWARFQLEREVTLNYFKALGAKLLEGVAEQNVRTLEDHLKDSRLFRRAGASTNYDVLQVEVQVSEARSELLNATDNTVLAKNALAESLGRAREERELVGPLPVMQAGLVREVLEGAEQERGDIQALESRARGADLLSAAAGRHWVPRISLFGTYQYYNNLDDRWLHRFRDAYQVGIQLNWNLFDGLASVARSKQAGETYVQNEKSLALARIRSRQDLELWKRRYLYYCSVYRSREEDIQKAGEAVRLAREGRKVGARTNTDLLDAEAELHRARAGAVNAQLGAIEALIRLELAAGREIHKFY